MPANKERSAARTAATRELVRSWSHPKRTTAEVAKLCGVSRSTAAQHLAARGNANGREVPTLTVPLGQVRIATGRRMPLRVAA